MEIHYLDNAATTKVLPEAAQAALACMTEEFGNPSAQYALGQRARAALQQARGQVAAALGCPPDRVIFTSGGSESINTALQSAVRRGRRFGRHIVSTQIEHKATLNTLRQLEQEGYEVTLVAPEPDGTVALEAILGALRPDTVLLTLMAVNSETGAILPVEQAAAEARRYAPHCLVHVDGIQAFCKLPLALANVDFLSVSGHKIGACKGVGALYCAEPKHLKPLIYGGGQEGNLRSGTEGMPQIVSFGVASQIRSGRREQEAEHMAALKELLLRRLDELPCPVRVNSPRHSAPHIVNLSPALGRSEVLVRVLSDQGVYVSGGSACTRGKRSYVLESMKVPAQAIDGALRVSFCPENTEEDVEALLSGLRQALALFD